MDKVKEILGKLNKQRFWVGSGLALVIVLVCWFLSTTTLEASYKKNYSAIDSKFKEIDSLIAQNKEHPNPTFIEGKEKEIKELKRNVYDVWTKRYQEQASKVYVWPAVLGEEFIAAVQQAGPKGDLPVRYRELYQIHVKSELARLCKIIDAAWVKDELPPADPRAPAETDPTKAITKHLVIWGDEDREAAPKKNQENIQKSLEWVEVPSTTKIFLTQEDLWVYEAFCRIIAQTNAGAKGHYEAPIKVLQSIQIGYDSFDNTYLPGGHNENRIARPKGGTTAPPPPPEGGGPVPGAPISKPPREGSDPNMAPPMPPAGDAPAVPAVPEAALLNWRYIDDRPGPDRERPLMAHEIETNPLFEYKLMPFRIRMMIDQRSIGKFLELCSRSVLPIEVRQYRFNATSKAQGNTASQIPDLSSKITGASYDGQLELRGVVYLINPPNLAKLEITPEGSPEAGADPADAAPPADASPTDAGAPASAPPAAATPDAAAPASGAPPAAVSPPPAAPPAGAPPAAAGAAPATPAAAVPAPAAPVAAPPMAPAAAAPAAAPVAPPGS